MRLLSKPINYNFNEPTTYDDFSFFRLAITERNWTGQNYVEKSNCLWFLKGLHMADRRFRDSIGSTESNTGLDFILDTSVFSGNISSNDQLMEYLHELESMDVEKLAPQMVIKLRGKLRNFSNHMENWVYLYRWALLNPNHFFSGELLELVDKLIVDLGKRSKNFFFKEGVKVEEYAMKMEKKGHNKQDVEAERDQGIVKVVVKAEQNDAANLTKLFKYCFKEASLFYFGIYASIKYYQQSDTVVKNKGKVFVSLYKKKNQIEVFLKDSTEFLDDTFLKHQPFLDTLPKTPRLASGVIRYYQSLYDVSNDEKQKLEEDKIEVIKAIVGWVSERIPENKYDIITQKNWIHMVKGDLLADAGIPGIEAIRFNGLDFIGGPEGSELLLRTSAYASEAEILFPVFAPKYWANLTSSQCALIAYAICLFHDICIESNYELVPTSIYGFDYELIITKEGQSTRLHTFGHITKPSKPTREQEHSRQEHWVSFHFRRLREGQSASDDARQKALRYGIKELPKRFTFVDSFVRGEKSIDPSEMRISALDVLNRTLGKIGSYAEPSENVQHP